MVNDSICIRANMLYLNYDPESCEPHRAYLNLIGLYIQYSCNFQVA